MKRTERNTTAPATAPASDVARPSCQVPGPIQAGSSSGFHSGQANTPAGIGTIGLTGNTAVRFGYGHGINVPPMRPMIVPVTVMLSGTSM